MSNQSVEVKLELGHRASLRPKPTSEGFTHDWVVFVRGPENSCIQYFVEKVVFKLHESFPKPKRVVKEPPYQVAESGYAGFIMPIEIYFRNKEEPKKVTFEYDLYLRVEEPPVNNIRCEKLIFPNPPEEFRKKLLKAGGTKTKTAGPTNSTGVSSSSLPTHSSKTEHSGETKAPTKHAAKPNSDSHKEKKSKTHSNNKDGSKPAVLPPPPPPPPPPAPRPTQPFTDIFGMPIKTRPSTDTTKPKENSNSSKMSGGNKGGKHPPQSSSGSSGVVNNPAIVMTSSSSKEHKSKESSKSKEGKAMKRPASPNSSSSSSSGKRKRASSSLPSSTPSSNKPTEVPEKKPESSKEKSKDGKEKKEKHKHKTDSNNNSSSNTNTGNSSGNSSTNNTNSSSKKEKSSKPSKSSSSESKSKHEKPSKSHKKASPAQPLATESKPITPARAEEKALVAAMPEPVTENPDLPMFTPERKVDTDLHVSRTQTEQSSPASSGSLPSPVAPAGKKGPLFAMMEEMEKESLSPLSSNPGSPLEFAPSSSSSKKKMQISYSDSEPEQMSNPSVKNEPKDERGDTEPSVTTHNGDIKGSDTDHLQKGPPFDPDYLAELVDLQRRIMRLDDRRYLQRIVDVIEETGLYQITSSTFDFDLCTLDQKTVRKLQGCLAIK